MKTRNKLKPAKLIFFINWICLRWKSTTKKWTKWFWPDRQNVTASTLPVNVCIRHQQHQWRHQHQRGMIRTEKQSPGFRILPRNRETATVRKQRPKQESSWFGSKVFAKEKCFIELFFNLKVYHVDNSVHFVAVEKLFFISVYFVFDLLCSFKVFLYLINWKYNYTKFKLDIFCAASKTTY